MSTAIDIEVWHAPTPIPRPVLTAAGRYDTYFHLVVVLRADGLTGWGYSGMATAAQLDGAAKQAQAIADRGRTLPELLAAEHHGYDTASRGASNAIALAAWDLAARRLGVACADMWGRRPGFEAVDAYASGFFLDASINELVDEAKQYREQGYRLVKMRTGLPLEDDLARFDAVRSVFPEPAAIAVDSFHLWTPQQARAFVDAVPVALLWVEDATPYDDLAQLKGLAAPLAAGESLETLDDLEALRARCSLDYALLDVQRIGGPQLFLQCAHALAARGARIGSHVYTAHSLHLLAAVNEPLPVEVFDWSDPLIARPPSAEPDGRILVRGPGFGIDINNDVLHRHGRQVLR